MAVAATLAVAGLAAATIGWASRREAGSKRRRGRGAPWLVVPVLMYVLGTWSAVNFMLPARSSADLNLYVIQPVLWGLLGVACFFYLSLSGDLKIAYRVVFFGVLAAAFHVLALVSAGVLYGFGYSPYARESVHMALNALYLGTMVLGVELCRAYLLSVLYEHRPFLAMAVVSLLFSLLLIPVNDYRALTSPDAGFQAAGQTFLPALAQSVLASYLVIRGGFLPAFLYHGGILAFEWLSPVLPALDWTVEAFITTVAPIISLLTTRSGLAGTTTTKADGRPLDVSAPWVILSMLIVALFWFNAGLFGVRPSVVTGVSMEPTMHTGDLVIMRQVEAEELGVGDIIQFRAGTTRVFHRIIQVADTSEGRVFVTQGDNNNTPDDPVLESQIEGEIVLTVPKAGWVQLRLAQLLSRLR